MRKQSVAILGILLHLGACSGSKTDKDTLAISTSGNGSTSPAAGRHAYASGSSVTVTATPASGAMFAGWSGAATGTTNPVTIVMGGDKALTASFSGGGGETTSYILTVGTSGNGSTSPAAGSHTYASGASVTVTATPASGAMFTGWSEAATGTTNPVTIGSRLRDPRARRLVSAARAPRPSGTQSRGRGS